MSLSNRERVRQVRAAVSAVGANVHGEGEIDGRPCLYLSAPDWERCAASWPFLVRGSRIEAIGVHIVEVTNA